MLTTVVNEDLGSLRSLYDYPLTLIDAGAGGGINRRWEKFRNLVAVGFEPDERAFNKLKHSDRFRWFQMGLYGSNGTFELNITRSQTGTSLLEPNLELIQTLQLDLSDFDIIRKARIPCRTLDSICQEYGLAPHVVKIDTQGTEIAILQGAERLLRDSIFAVEAEVEFLPFYKNQALFTDVHLYLARLGFQLMDYMNPVRVRGRHSSSERGARSHLLSADTLYFKTIECMIEDLKQSNKASLSAAVAICVAYGCDDYALELCRAVRQMVPALEERTNHHLRHLQKLQGSWHRRTRDFLTRFKIMRSIGKRIRWYLTPSERSPGLGSGHF